MNGRKFTAGMAVTKKRSTSHRLKLRPDKKIELIIEPMDQQ